MTAWVTAEQATDICNREVSPEQITAAMAVIEIYVGVTPDALAALKPRDVRLLQKATAFQAVWMPAQADLLTRMDVDQVNQDGIQFVKGNADAHLLAPLAKKSIEGLSWMRSRAIIPLTPAEAARRRGVYLPGTGVTGSEEWLDDQQTWRPM